MNLILLFVILCITGAVTGIIGSLIICGRYKKQIDKDMLETIFELEKAIFNEKGITRESILDVEADPAIVEKVKERRHENKRGSYIKECINAEICPSCGTADQLEEIRIPKEPGCWLIMKKCKKCAWQAILSDLYDQVGEY